MYGFWGVGQLEVRFGRVLGLGGRARSVQIVDCCVHTSTAGLGVTSPFDADAAVQKKEVEEEEMSP